MISLFEKIFQNNKPDKSFSDDLESLFKVVYKIVDTDGDMFMNKDCKGFLFFGSIYRNEYKFKIMKKIHYNFFQPNNKIYEVFGKVEAKCLHLYFKFPFNNFLHQIFVMLIFYILIMSSIYNKNYFLLILGFIYYVILDFLFNLILHFNRKLYKKDFFEIIKYKMDSLDIQ